MEGSGTKKRCQGTNFKHNKFRKQKCHSILREGIFSCFSEQREVPRTFLDKNQSGADPGFLRSGVKRRGRSLLLFGQFPLKYVRKIG